MPKEACSIPKRDVPEEQKDFTRHIDSRTLFGEERVLTIQHGDDFYTLRITRAEKLLLTK